MLNFLAFDLGASNGRTILGRYNGERITLSELNRFPNSYIRIGDDYYWNVLHLFNCLKDGIREYTKTYDEPLSGLGIDTWGVDFGLIDKTGRLVGNPRSYRDPRGRRGMEAFHKKFGERTVFDISGVSNMEFNTLYQLTDMVNSHDPQLEIADKLLLMPDLLGYMLSGVISCEYTEATTTQMMDAKTRTWSKEIIDMVGIKPSLFTDIQMSGEVKGHLLQHIADEVGLTSCPPIINVGSHDTASAVASIPAKQDNIAFISSGTWSLVGATGNMAIINDMVFENNLSNEGTFNGGIQLLQNIMGLWVIQNCKKRWDKQEKLSWSDIIDKAKAAPPFRSFVNINDPLFYDRGNMPKKIQQYCADTNQYVPQTQGEIARTVFESLAMSYLEAFMALEKLQGQRIETMHIVGGGSQNEFLNQITASAINRKVVSGPVEATAIGNILMQLKSTGEVKDAKDMRHIIRNSFELKTYTPQNSDRWSSMYKTYLKIKK